MMLRFLFGLLGLGVGMAHAADMIALRYVDQDPGSPPYLTRILVTPDFLRMDSGRDDDDFVLLDRRKRTVINVLRSSGTAMVFVPGKLPPKPADWASTLETHATPRGQAFKLTVKGQVCSEGVAARSAAPDAARAMAELKAVLAVTQYRVWEASPADLRYDCDLANHVWDLGATLSIGLPLDEREFSGRSRKIESESREPYQPALFRIPKGMARVNAPS